MRKRNGLQNPIVELKAILNLKKDKQAIVLSVLGSNGVLALSYILHLLFLFNVKPLKTDKNINLLINTSNLQ
jgi:hypothetical protein